MVRQPITGVAVASCIEVVPGCADVTPKAGGVAKLGIAKSLPVLLCRSWVMDARFVMGQSTADGVGSDATEVTASAAPVSADAEPIGSGLARRLRVE